MGVEGEGLGGVAKAVGEVGAKAGVADGRVGEANGEVLVAGPAQAPAAGGAGGARAVTAGGAFGVESGKRGRHGDCLLPEGAATVPSLFYGGSLLPQHAVQGPAAADVPDRNAAGAVAEIGRASCREGV